MTCVYMNTKIILLSSVSNRNEVLLKRLNLPEKYFFLLTVGVSTCSVIQQLTINVNQLFVLEKTEKTSTTISYNIADLSVVVYTCS